MTLYFEGHVLVRLNPEFVHDTCALELAQNLGWWASRLEDDLGPDETDQAGDVILTTRRSSQEVLLERIRNLVEGIAPLRVRILRYKVEVATVDSNIEDVLDLLRSEP
jgi:hypothetical protein